MPNTKQELEKAKQLILKKNYEQARKVLSQLPDSITAQNWLSNLDKIAPSAGNALDEKQELEKAKQLIITKEFGQARKVLFHLPNNVTAQKWLLKLDEIAPFSQQAPAPKVPEKTISLLNNLPQEEETAPLPQNTPESRDSAEDVPFLGMTQIKKILFDIGTKISSFPYKKTLKLLWKQISSLETIWRKLGGKSRIIFGTLGIYIVTTILIFLFVGPNSAAYYRNNDVLPATLFWVWFGFGATGLLTYWHRSNKLLPWIKAIVPSMLKGLFTNPLGGLLLLPIWFARVWIVIAIPLYIAGMTGPIGTILGILLPTPSSKNISK